jgi:hypothetical protein
VKSPSYPFDGLNAAGGLIDGEAHLLEHRRKNLAGPFVVVDDERPTTTHLFV